MTNWQKQKLGKLFIFKNGLNKSVEYFGHGTPIVNYVDVNKKPYMTKESVKGLVEVTESEKENCSAKQGDVFFTRTSETLDEIGLSSVLLDDVKDCVFSGYVLRARPITNELLPEYCKYSFRTLTIRKEIMRKSSMTTRALTSGKFLSEVDFAYPEKAEQERIVEVLEAWDEYLELLDKKIALKERLKKGLMQQLLTGKRRLPGFNNEWSSVKIGQIAEVTAGGTPSTKNKEYWENGDTLWMKSGEINKTYVHDTNLRITRSGLDSSSAKILPTNSVLIAIAGQGSTRGKVAVNRVPLSTNQSVAAFLPSNKLYYGFLFWNLRNRYDELRALSAGDGGRGGLNLFLLKNLRILLPELEEQQAISKIFFSMDEEVALLQSIRRMAVRQKKYLLKNLITGAIRVPERSAQKEAVYA